MLNTANYGSTRRALNVAAKPVYGALLRESGGDFGHIDDLARSASKCFLLECLHAVSDVDCDFPEDLRALQGWLERQHRQAAAGYHAYLVERHVGGSRRFFANRSHAMYFLRCVAPTKLVDGAWLYGLLPHWDDPRFAGLVRTYLDELGRGQPAQNHVALYRKLLRSQGLDGFDGLADGHYTQGAVQLALGHHAGEFLPEVIGFNLGYEQLPLHLPITAYELAELGIDPYYFTLHVTVDNAASGHAKLALDAVHAAWPRLGDRRRFLQRVAAGYKLNFVGMGTVEVIDTFDLEVELFAMLARKAETGALLHSDYCRVGGQTVTEWLGDVDRIPEFLRALERLGWIRRGETPANSRFWRLLHDEGAPMFGAFNAWEQALIADWISYEPSSSLEAEEVSICPFRRRTMARSGQTAPSEPLLPHNAFASAIVQQHLRSVIAGTASDFDIDLHLLADRLESVTEPSAVMGLLTGFLSPGNHATPVGLLATRIFSSLLDTCG